MNYYFNCSKYKKIFAVPTEIVEKHIKLAGPVQLKALLWILSHPDDDCTDEAISKALGISSVDIADAMQYWISCKMINTENGEAVTESEPETPKKPAPPVKPSAPKSAKESRLTRSEAIKIGAADAKVKWLLQEAQKKLGRTLSATDITALVSLNTQMGLPCEVIIMILEYSVSREKTYIGYIEKIAADWANRDIDSVSKAEQHLKNIELTETYWRKIQTAFSMEYRAPSAKEEEYARKWLGEWHFSDKMLKKAYDICVDNKGKLIMNYVNTILNKWFENSITTPEQADKSNLDFKSQKSKKSSGVDKIPDEDLDAIEDIFNNRFSK